MDKQTRTRLLTSLKLAALRAEKNGWKAWAGWLWGAASHCEIGLEINRLALIRSVTKLINGRDPIEGDTHLEGEKQPGLARSDSRRSPSLQDLRGKIGDKAKADKAWRFWGLFVHVAKLETLQEAYRLAKLNDGERSAGNLHATFDEAGAGNATTGVGMRPTVKAVDPPPDPKARAPALDPTERSAASSFEALRT